jgi:aquaporin Z
MGKLPIAANIARYVAEFLGTFFLTLAVGCATLSDTYVWGATCCACTLMVLVYAFAPVSGAHLNPAVSAAIFMANRLTLQELLIYVLVQCLGAAWGATTYSFLFMKSFNVAPALGFSWNQAMSAELIYTMMLCFVVLSCVFPVRDGTAGEEFAPLAIGFVLLAGAHGAGAISGGCFNPAVAFAIDVSSAGLGFGWSIAYAGFELVGAALAAVLYRLTRPAAFGLRDRVVHRGSGQVITLSMLISELFGTFILAVTVGFNVLGESTAGAWSVGAALLSMVYALGDVSGAHFNPAVTVAITCTGRYEKDVPNTTKAMFYMASQFLGGLLGAWVFSITYDWHTFSLRPTQNYPIVAQSSVLVFSTFVLCLTVLSVACLKYTEAGISLGDRVKGRSGTLATVVNIKPSGDFRIRRDDGAVEDCPRRDCELVKVLDVYFGIAIGFAITVGGFVVGTVSGGTMNPAVTFGVYTTGFFCKNCIGLLGALSMMIDEFVGGALAAFVFSLIHPEEYLGVLGKMEKKAEIRNPAPVQASYNTPLPATSQAVYQHHELNPQMMSVPIDHRTPPPTINTPMPLHGTPLAQPVQPGIQEAYGSQPLPAYGSYGTENFQGGIVPGTASPTTLSLPLGSGTFQDYSSNFRDSPTHQLSPVQSIGTMGYATVPATIPRYS